MWSWSWAFCGRSISQPCTEGTLSARYQLFARTRLSQDQHGGVGRCDALWYRSPSSFPALATANVHPELVSDPRFKDEEILGSNDAQKLAPFATSRVAFFDAPV